MYPDEYPLDGYDDDPEPDGLGVPTGDARCTLLEDEEDEDQPPPDFPNRACADVDASRTITKNVGKRRIIGAPEARVYA